MAQLHQSFIWHEESKQYACQVSAKKRTWKGRPDLGHQCSKRAVSCGGVLSPSVLITAIVLLTFASSGFRVVGSGLDCIGHSSLGRLKNAGSCSHDRSYFSAAALGPRVQQSAGF